MNYWAVGANWGGNEDVSSEFIEKNIWYDGYAANEDDRDKYALENVKKGDFLLMKSSATKGAGHATTFTKLKAIGEVIEKENYYSFKVKWLPIKELPKDFDGISYRKTIEQMRDDEMLNFAQSKTNKLIEMDRINDAISLLKYKNQIILQGPPGTGKTREAKLIAEELIKTRTIGNPENIVDSFIKQFNSNDENVKNKREDRAKLLSVFYSLFPKENLNNLSLENYCIGRYNKENFCWWLERGLKPLGYFFPGSSYSYLIYWSKSTEKYSKHGFIKDIEDDEEAMNKVADLLYEVVQTQKTDRAIQYFGDSFLIKLLNSYYPDEYFPINSGRILENALKIFKVESKGLSTFEKNQKLNQIYLEKKKQFGSDIDSFEFAEILYGNFNLKTGEIINTEKEIVANGMYKIIQFHPAYSYEDFVRGIMADTDENGNISYHVENKILAEFAETAKDSPNDNFVLIIDEINRANLSAVLGELIYALEYRNEAISSMYEFNNDREIILPKNLFIIGTMNTADRSVGHIDYAIRRRFAFVDILPDENVITNPKAKVLFQNVAKLFSTDYLSPDFNKKDVMIGHSYFLAKDEDELKIRLEYEIKPILKEYLKDGIFLESANEKIEELNV